MNAAYLERSARLQRVDELLADGLEHSTWEIVAGAQVCAVNSIIAELRANGRQIRCIRRGRRWYYQAHRKCGCGAYIHPDAGRYGCANCFGQMGG